MNQRSRILVFMAVAVILMGAGTLIVGSWLEDWRADVNELWDKVVIGNSEAEVIHLLGEPYRQYDSGVTHADYYISGYRFKERPITGRVFIYLGKDMVLYVWLDQNGRVEDLYRGGS